MDEKIRKLIESLRNLGVGWKPLYATSGGAWRDELKSADAWKEDDVVRLLWGFYGLVDKFCAEHGECRTSENEAHWHSLELFFE
jgi:hypothetical protein